MLFPAYRNIDLNNLYPYLIAGGVGILILYFISRKRYKLGFKKNFFTGEFKKTYPGLEICFQKWVRNKEAFSHSIGLHGTIRCRDNSKQTAKLSDLFDSFETEETLSGSITFFKINKFDFTQLNIEVFIEKVDQRINEL